MSDGIREPASPARASGLFRSISHLPPRVRSPDAGYRVDQNRTHLIYYTCPVRFLRLTPPSNVSRLAIIGDVSLSRCKLAGMITDCYQHRGSDGTYGTHLEAGNTSRYSSSAARSIKRPTLESNGTGCRVIDDCTSTRRYGITQMGTVIDQLSRRDASRDAGDRN